MRTITIGFLLIFIGILFILVGIFSMVHQIWKTENVEKPEVDVRGGGIVMIGPIPIIFGTDIGALKLVIILAIVLMIIAMLFFPSLINIKFLVLNGACERCSQIKTSL